MSQARKGIVDIPVIDFDKAMNCGWKLTSKELNKETSICDSKINVIFCLFFYFYTKMWLSKQVPLSDIYETLRVRGL